MTKVTMEGIHSYWTRFLNSEDDGKALFEGIAAEHGMGFANALCIEFHYAKMMREIQTYRGAGLIRDM